jgi:hypothetical protein
MIDQIFYIRQILEKRMEYNGTAHQLFIDFNKAYDSVRREILCNILSEFELARKLVGLNKMCLNETYSTHRVGKYQSERGRRSVTTAFQLCFGFRHWEGPREPGTAEIE